MCKCLLQKCFEHNHFSTQSTNQALGSNSKPNKGGEIVLYYKTIKDLYGTWKSLFPWTPADWKELLALFLTALTLSWPLDFLLLQALFTLLTQQGDKWYTSPCFFQDTSTLLRSQHCFNKTMTMYIIRRETIFVFKNAKVWENKELLMSSV